MAEPLPETVSEAIEQVAKGMVRIQRDGDGQEMEYLSIDELVKASRHLAGKQAARNANLGMMMRKAIPPGGG